MITNKHVLGKVAAVWKPGLFGQPWADLIAGWCVSWHQTYRTPPGKGVKSLFEIWAEDGTDETTEKGVAAFLGGLSDEYDETGFNGDYVADLAGQVINRQRLVAMRNKLDAALAVNDLDRAEAALASPRIEVGNNSAVDVFASPYLVKAAVLSRTNVEPLVKFPGALGTFTELLFERESLVALEAPEKRGKSWGLQEVAWQAVLQGRKVAFFSCGDMSEIQMMRRLVTRANARPIAGTKFGQTVKIPTFIEKLEASSMATVTYEEKKFPDPLDYRKAWDAFKEITKESLGGRRDLLKLSTHPTCTLSVAGMRSILDRWADGGWRPDIVAIDYADILAPPPGRMESKEAIDHNWSQLRALSISDHILVLTATQTNAASYTVEVIGKGNFSGSKGKNAHVTAMIGINQSPAEKDMGVYRLNLPAARESELNDQTCVYVAGCLAVANPFILSTF